MFKIGVMHGAHYIVLVQDNYCPDMDRLMKVIEDAKHPKYAYIGEKMWNKQVHIHAMTDLYALILFSALCFRSSCVLKPQLQHAHRLIHIRKALTANLSNTSTEPGSMF